MNIKTGKVTNLEINFHYSDILSVKSCPISLIGNKVYVICAGCELNERKKYGLVNNKFSTIFLCCRN